MCGKGPTRRRRVERGIYEQENGKYAVCVMVAGRPPLPDTRHASVDRSAPTASLASDAR